MTAPTESASSTAIGSRLRRIREDRGLTQVEVAERVGVTQGQVSEYETGRRGASVARLVELARALDASLDVLVGME